MNTAPAGLPCAFEKALLARCGACALASRSYRGEHESVACASPVARENCFTLRELLLANSAFALKLARTTGEVPHAAALKSQCGGLAGLQRAVTQSDDIADVHELVTAAREKFGGLEALPYATIVQSVSAYRGRNRR